MNGATHDAEIPGYSIHGVVGEGAFARVYEATQHSLDRRVALKVLNHAGDAVEEDTARRFRREAQAVGRLSGHPNVITVHDAGETSSGRLFLAMELLRKGSFGSLIRRQGPLDSHTVARIGAEVASALDAVHAEGVLHRDVKPDNILVAADDRAVLTDFGIAELTDKTRTETVTGTLPYTAPEVMDRRDQVGEAVDVFGLGATLFTLVSGTLAFASVSDPPATIIHKVTAGPPATLPPAVDPRLATLIYTCLAKRPSDRPAIADLRSRLLAIATEVHTAPAPDPEVGASESGRVNFASPPPRHAPPVERPAIGPSESAPSEIASSEAASLCGASADGPTRDRNLVGPHLEADRSGRRDPWSRTEVDVGSGSVAVLATPAATWVAKAIDDHTVARVNPVSDRLVAQVQVGRGPSGMAVDAVGDVWVACWHDDTVVEIDPVTNRAVRSVAVGGNPQGIDAGHDAVWVACWSTGEVHRIAASTGEVTSIVSVGDGPRSLACSDDAVWVAVTGDDQLVRLRPDGSIDRSFRVEAPGRVCTSGDEVWVLQRDLGTVVRVDAEGGHVTATVDLQVMLRDLTSTGDTIWVAGGGPEPLTDDVDPSSAIAGSVWRIDRQTSQVVGEAWVPGVPWCVDACDGSVWVTDLNGSAITRFDE